MLDKNTELGCSSTSQNFVLKHTSFRGHNLLFMGIRSDDRLPMLQSERIETVHLARMSDSGHLVHENFVPKHLCFNGRPVR